MLLPLFCMMCQHITISEHPICNSCLSMLYPLGNACNRCALPLSNAGTCGSCLKNNPEINKVITYYRFEGILRKIIHEFKYNEKLNLAKLLSNLMLMAHNDYDYNSECLIPVPLHKKKLMKRGYNQSIILTKHLSHKLKVPYDISLCSKIHQTLNQAQLNLAQRQHNLKNVFIAKNIPYTHVTLIDDLITTGQTANELARVLKKQGVNKVDLWCCARSV